MSAGRETGIYTRTKDGKMAVSMETSQTTAGEI